MTRRGIGAALLSITMLLLAAVVGLPFYYIVVNTLKTQQETGNAPLALPSRLFLDNYLAVFQTIPIAQNFPPIRSI